MIIESIITDALCTYTGIPEFCIVKHNYGYSCLFEDGIRVDFSIKCYPSKDFVNDLVKTIYERYLQQSREEGMNCK